MNLQARLSHGGLLSIGLYFPHGTGVDVRGLMTRRDAHVGLTLSWLEPVINILSEMPKPWLE